MLARKSSSHSTAGSHHQPAARIATRSIEGDRSDAAANPSAPATKYIGKMNRSARTLAGLSTTTNTTVVTNGKPDLAVRVDWIRFARP